MQYFRFLPNPGRSDDTAHHSQLRLLSGINSGFRAVLTSCLVSEIVQTS